LHPSLVGGVEPADGAVVVVVEVVDDEVVLDEVVVDVLVELVLVVELASPGGPAWQWFASP
jgi:hypothetical protein